MGPRGGGLVAAAAPEPEPVVVEIEPELEPDPIVEPRERLRYVRRPLAVDRTPLAAVPQRDPLLETLGRTLETLAAKETPAPILNVHLASPDLSVRVEQAPAPDVTVENHLPEQVPAAVQVDVHTPAAEPPPVLVTVEQPRPQPLVVKRDAEGRVSGFEPEGGQ